MRQLNDALLQFDRRHSAELGQPEMAERKRPDLLNALREFFWQQMKMLGGEVPDDVEQGAALPSA